MSVGLFEQRSLGRLEGGALVLALWALTATLSSTTGGDDHDHHPARHGRRLQGQLENLHFSHVNQDRELELRSEAQQSSCDSPFTCGMMPAQFATHNTMRALDGAGCIPGLRLQHEAPGESRRASSTKAKAERLRLITPMLAKPTTYREPQPWPRRAYDWDTVWSNVPEGRFFANGTCNVKEAWFCSLFMPSGFERGRYLGAYFHSGLLDAMPVPRLALDLGAGSGAFSWDAWRHWGDRTIVVSLNEPFPVDGLQKVLASSKKQHGDGGSSEGGGGGGGGGREAAYAQACAASRAKRGTTEGPGHLEPLHGFVAARGFLPVAAGLWVGHVGGLGTEPAARTVAARWYSR